MGAGKVGDMWGEIPAVRIVTREKPRIMVAEWIHVNVVRDTLTFGEDLFVV